MSVFGWSLPAGCTWLPYELDDIPAFCDSQCPYDEPPEDCDCNPDNCLPFALTIHLRSCLKHHCTFGDGCSCDGCICDAEIKCQLEMEEFDRKMKGIY